MNDGKSLDRVADRFEDPKRFLATIGEIDRLNNEDPNRYASANIDEGYELFFSKQLTAWILALDPEASEALLVAGRGQHICRWKIPRKDYPMNRAGYLKWRSELKRFHAEITSGVLKTFDYPDAFRERVRSLNLKLNLKKDPECQVLEDALCLVFLEKQFASFSQKTDREKMIGILRKTWAKMSEQGRKAALGLDLDASALALVQEAIG